MILLDGIKYLSWDPLCVLDVFEEKHMRLVVKERENRINKIEGFTVLRRKRGSYN